LINRFFFLKSTAVINSEVDNSPLKNIVLRLGGFHTEMSFFGSIGIYSAANQPILLAYLEG
jgi:hypothetical protein